VGCWQITALRRESKLERTLAACSRYESDAVIERCVRNLRTARRHRTFDDAPLEFQQDAIVVLNYLDTLAIGIRQKLYNERLAKDHTKEIIVIAHLGYHPGMVARLGSVMPDLSGHIRSCLTRSREIRF
jgi:hypothetical protein